MANRRAESCGLDGVVALLVTPFDENEAVAWETYRAYVDWQVGRGPRGLFAVCGSGEMGALTLDERLRLARIAVRRAGDVPVVATANLESGVEKNLDEVRAMEDTGVSGIVLVGPWRKGDEPSSTVRYYARLADAVACDVYLYEWPSARPRFIEPEEFAYLASRHGVRGIKDTTCTEEGIAAKVRAAPDAVVFQANTPLLPEAIRAGARGIMATTTTVAADLASRYWDAAIADPGGDAAADLHHQLVFLDLLLRRGHPAVAKYLINLRGCPMPTRCRPSLELPEETLAAARAWLDAFASADLTADLAVS